MSRKCEFYYNPDTPNYLVEYRGDFKAQIDKISYACGDTITETIAIVSLKESDIVRLYIDVPAIISVDFRATFVLQNISPSNIDNINFIQNNPYLNLNGSGVLIGMIDTGIDYLNKEFIREDDTSRIHSIWDQTIRKDENDPQYIGKVYSNEQINLAIKAQKDNQDPYLIVPSKDIEGHGTKAASIIGARGYNKEIKGIANDCEFVVVKLFDSSTYRRMLQENRIKYTPVYNNSEVLAGLEYLKRVFEKVRKPMVIYIGIGSNAGAHDGSSVLERYVTTLATNRGICIVAGVGNEGAAEGHASGVISGVGDIKNVSLNIPREIKTLSFNIWVRVPNRASINVIAPDGEASKFIESKKEKIKNYKFVFMNTEMNVIYYDVESFTGHQVIRLIFKDIKTGIWTFQLMGENIVDGRFDIWLPPSSILPERTVFLEPDPFITLQIPSTAISTVTVAYYGSNNTIIPASGRGYNLDDQINPDIATMGVNIATTEVGGRFGAFTGSSAATAVTAGVCALILQWGIVQGNDKSIYSKKVRSYLLYGAYRNKRYVFPNRETGYGDLDILGTFKIISGAYRKLRESSYDGFTEYYVKDLFIRLPKGGGGL